MFLPSYAETAAAPRLCMLYCECIFALIMVCRSIRRTVLARIFLPYAANSSTSLRMANTATFQLVPSKARIRNHQFTHPLKIPKCQDYFKRYLCNQNNCCTFAAHFAQCVKSTCRMECCGGMSEAAYVLTKTKNKQTYVKPLRGRFHLDSRFV